MVSAISYATVSHIEPSEPDTPCSAPMMSRPASRPLGICSSLTSISSNSLYDSRLSSPDTPLQFSRIPFSWEQKPGIPKKEIPKKNDTSQLLLLPLPPAGNSSKPTRKQGSEQISPKKNTADSSFKRDPFFVALMECSKDDDEDDGSLASIWKSLKITKCKNDPLGIIGMYTSCKRMSAVSESVVYLPRSRAYNLINRRSS